MTERQNLTDKTLSFWNDLKNKRPHPAPCCCPSCLYIEYQKGLKTQKRLIKRSKKRMFFFAWLIHHVKLEYLRTIQLKKGESLEVPLSKFLEHYKKAPYLRKTYEILSKIDEFVLLDYSALCSYKSRVEKINFLKLEEDLTRRRNLEWLSSKPKEMKIWKQNWDDLKFAQRTADFIDSRPGKKTTQRDLLKHFSNKRKEDLERIQDSLKINWQIEIKTVKRSIVYRRLK